MNDHKKGFTIAELLIVVAIIAVLVGIAIPVFNAQLEKSRRTVDIANARSIQSQLMAMVNSGEIEIPNSLGDYKGAWVTVVGENGKPSNNDQITGTIYFGADASVIVNGDTSKQWNKENEELKKSLKQFQNLSVKSGGTSTEVDGIKGWDWYVVQVYYDQNTNSIQSIIYSGVNNNDGSIAGRNPKPTYIEQWINR